MEDSIGYPCPYCKDRGLQTAEKVPYVRGFVLAYQIGYKTYVGCCPCVRLKVLRETGLSALLGWFSITALLVNPFLITYGLFRAMIVSTNLPKVREYLAKAGIPDPADAQVDIEAIAYSLAASMIAADGKIEREEVAAAVTIGEKILEHFDGEAFGRVVANHDNLPSPVDQAAILANVLDANGKKLVCQYLAAIAAADGDVAPAERELLGRVADRLGVEDISPA